MTHSEFRQISIPLGATISLTREDGTKDIYILRGDQQGSFYEDQGGQRHSDIGIYLELAIKTEGGWQLV
ncbi:hypothetical protein [Pseudoduganella violacea]|uniref:Uncharacterized protein n=1 Tax=Pseudoduganella violacea TaxID=1715466 RepID=A0A7W5FWX5_9BURK|nr:hypothetical protein [Pseudoduganella violacea]MBB3122495.1 hypothetical protein [Pseudoduganella violacea]